MNMILRCIHNLDIKPVLGRCWTPSTDQACATPDAFRTARHCKSTGVAPLLRYAVTIPPFYQGGGKYAREMHSDLRHRTTESVHPLPKTIPTTALWLMVMLILGMVTGCTTRIEPPGTSVVTVEADSRSSVGVTATMNRLILDISSERGIGHANVVLPVDHQYTEIEIRLHMRGLEQFVITRGVGTDANERIELSVSGLDDSLHQVHIVSTGTVITRTDLDEESPYWMDVEVVPAVGEGDTNARPNLYIVRSAVIDEFGRAFTVRWVDFWR